MNYQPVFIKKQWLIRNKNTNINNHYDLETNRVHLHQQVLGTGAFGTVFRGKIKGTRQMRAIKKIPKAKVKNKKDFINQIEILQKLVTITQQDHPNIIKLYQTFEDARSIYLVTEYFYLIRLCSGGQLFDKIMEKKFFTQIEARFVFTQIIHALIYIHSRNIAHRDLKPQNFLLLNKSEDSPIKIIDFGLSHRFNQELDKKQQNNKKKKMKSVVGTSYYMAPEVIQGNQYNLLCDIWSAGVILYILLSGIPPFNGETDEEILQQVNQEKYTFNSMPILSVPQMSKVSSEAKDLIAKMLVRQNKRPEASQLLNHPWMKVKLNPNLSLNLNFQTLKNFTEAKKLKKIALTYIATQMGTSEILELNQLFKSLDLNGDGVLTMEEIKAGIKQFNQNNALQLQQLVKSIDMNGNGTIDYTQFIAASLDKNQYLKQQNMLMVFNNLDLDGSGKITKDQLKEVLGSKVIQQEQDKINGKNEDYWNEMIKQADLDGDGEIDYHEFVNMMRNQK